MNEGNAVRQILISSGNQALVGAGLTPDNIAAGQIGVFDKDTNLSIAAATVPKNFYIVVGGTATKPIETATWSAGNKIPTALLNNHDVQAYVAPVAQVVKMNGFQSVCETDTTILSVSASGHLLAYEWQKFNGVSYDVIVDDANYNAKDEFVLPDVSNAELDQIKIEIRNKIQKENTQ